MNPRVISFHYTLTSPSGETLDSSEGKEPLTYLEGAEQIIPGLENQMGKLKAGDKKKILVSAADGYGLREEKYVLKVPRKQFQVEEVKVGDEYYSSEDEHAIPFKVIALSESEVTLDANHPLAGMDL